MNPLIPLPPKPIVYDRNKALTPQRHSHLRAAFPVRSGLSGESRTTRKPH